MAEDDFPTAGSITWQHIGQWRFLLVLGRTLALQIAHPVVGAGVIEHSTYRAHPWRRAEHTLDSLQRLCYADPAARAKEIKRIGRQHHRISGVDAHGRSYSAADPAARAWVLATIVDAIDLKCDLAGEPLSREEKEQLLGEWRAIGVALGLAADALPATYPAFVEYRDAMLRDVLEDNPAAREVLGPFYRRAATPRALRWVPGLWPLIRPLAARLIVAVVVASLPPQVRTTFGLTLTRRARAWSWLVHHGARWAMRAQPRRWRYLPYAAKAIRAAERRQAESQQPDYRRGGLLRRDLRARKLGRLFDHVLDQNGDGTLTWNDLQAMARAATWDTELAPRQEAELFEGFAAWWRQLCRDAGIGPEGSITRKAFVTVTLAGLSGDADAYLAAGLDQAIAALFAVADADQDGYLDQADYRRVFGGHAHPAELAHGFRQLDHDGDGQISAAEFIDGFRAFFTARGKSAAGSHLLGQP